MSAYAKGLYNINLYIYLVDTPLTFGTFNSCPEVTSLLIPLAFKSDKRVLPHFNFQLGVIIGGILLSSIGFYFPLSYLNIFNECNTLDEIVCLITPVKLYSNALEEKSAIFEDNRGKSGVYVWKNLVTGSIYVGSSIDLGRRFREYYRFDLLANKRPNSIIHRALLKYGYSFFSLEILEYCDKQETFVREQYYLDLLQPEYNICKVAGVYAGYKHSEEIRREMSESRMGKNNSFFGKTHSEEALALIRAAALNREKPSVPGLEVEISDLQTKLTTTYDSVRKAADAINSDIKTILLVKRLN